MRSYIIKQKQAVAQNLNALALKFRENLKARIMAAPSKNSASSMQADLSRQQSIIFPTTPPSVSTLKYRHKNIGAVVPKNAVSQFNIEQEFIKFYN